jgi:hypothetical protein
MKKIVFSILFFSVFALCFVHSASAQVSNVKAEYDSDTSVLITWNYTNTANTQAEIEIAKSPSGVAGTFTVLVKLPASLFQTRDGFLYKDTNVNQLIKPYYRVSSGQEATTPIVQATIRYDIDPHVATGALSVLRTNMVDPPIRLAATAGDGQVALIWETTSVNAGTTFNVKSSLSSAGPFNVIKSLLTTPNFTVTGLPNGTMQYFVVSAIYNGNESPNSASVSATPKVPPVKLTAPTGLAGRAISGDTVNLYWNALAGATSYSIKMAKTSGGPYTTLKSGLTTTRFEAYSLTRSTTYYFVVSATNELGQSPNSPQFQVATPNYIR